MVTRTAPGVRPALVVALLAIEAAAIVLATRPAGQERRGDDACVRWREDAQVLAEQVQGLRARVYDAEVRLASRGSARSAPDAPAPPATAPENLPPPEERTAVPPPAADDPLTRIADVQAREPADPRWAAMAESRLRDLARGLGAAALVERVLCSGTLCRVELTHGPGAMPSKSLDAFVSGASELMAQTMIQPDETGGKTTLVFARAGSTLPAAEGGGG
jgi:hypothetical protein